MAVPPQVSGDAVSVSGLLAIDKICRQFEAELEAGRKPQIEDFLGETPEPQRGQLRHELETIQREHGQKSERHVTLAQFVQNLVASRLMTEDQVQTALDEQPPNQRPQSGDELAKLLHRQGRLTRFQAQAVYQGKTRGLVLGNYVLLDKLGRGGMGQVFRARHRRMGRVVALKMLPPKEMRSQDAVKRFRREVKAAARLSHANIVATHDANEADGIQFLVMECVEGQDLASLVKQQGPLDVAAAVDYVLQAAQGLDYAHRQGVVHRDIKPANILIDEQGTIKVLDMGLARVETPAEGEQSLTHTGQVMGTLDYMSPEQALDTRHVDGRTDIYSLGCTLYYLLAGRPPYGGDTMTKKILAHRENPIPSLREARPEAPEALEVIFAQMLAKDFEQRQASMAEVIGQLNAVRAELSNVPASATDSEPALAETVSITADPVPSTSRPRASDVGEVPLVVTPKGTPKRRSVSVWERAQRLTRQGYQRMAGLWTRGAGKPKPAAAGKYRIPRVPLLIGLGVLSVAGLFLGIAFLLRDGDRTVRVEIDPALIKDATVSVWMDGRQMEIAGIGETIRLKPGEHGYEIRRGDEIITAREFTVLKGDNPALRIRVEAGGDAPGGTPLAAEDARTLSDLVQRRGELWLQRAIFGPQDDTFWEGFGVFQRDGQSDSVGFRRADELKEEVLQKADSMEEARLGAEMPQGKAIGPVGLIRFDHSWEIRTQGIWHSISPGMAIAARRDGQWKMVAAIVGDWRLGPSDRYDPGNGDHVALQHLLDQVSEALVRKDLDTLRGLSHSEYFGVCPDLADPSQAFVSHGSEDRQTSEEMLQQVTFDAYKHTITTCKVQGPLAVTISRRERTIGGQTATAQDVNFYGRTEKGWQAIISAEGDWTDLLMAEPKPRVIDGSYGAKDLPELCRRIRDAWAQRDFTPSRNLAWRDCFLFAIAVPQSPEYLIADFDDGIRALSNGLRTIDEVVPLTDPPVYEAQGPLAIVRWKKARLRMGENWHTIEGLDVGVQRDGLWRCAVSIDGDWRMTPEDRYDSSDEVHREIRRYFDEVNRAHVEENIELVRSTHHPLYRAICPVPASPEKVSIIDRDELRKAVGAFWQGTTVREHQAEILQIKRNGTLALALTSGSHVDDHGRQPASKSLHVFCQTPDGWVCGLIVAGDWSSALVTEKVQQTGQTVHDDNGSATAKPAPTPSPGAEDIPELLRRNQDAWVQRDFSPSRNLWWPDCYLFAGADPQSHEVQIVDANERIGPPEDFLRAIDEFVPFSDPPIYEKQGPLAVMRGKTVRFRLGDKWHTVEGLGVLIQRDDQWRWAFGMEGEWGMTSADRYDPNNSDHVALQRLLDQGGEAMVRKDAAAIRNITHPDSRNFPGGPAVARQTDFTDEMFANSAIEKHQHTITAVKVQGPLAVTLAQLDHVEAGRSSTQQGRLNIYARTNEGWRLLVWVAGDWRNVLMADSER